MGAPRSRTPNKSGARAIAGALYPDLDRVEWIPSDDADVFRLRFTSGREPGNCAALGIYADASGNTQVLTTDEVNGTWGGAGRLPGQANQGVFSPQSSVSCWSAGNCAAGGVIATPTGL